MNFVPHTDRRERPGPTVPHERTLARQLQLRLVVRAKKHNRRTN